MSALRCKPGDLALVLGVSQYSGKFCRVLFLAPPHDFILPDGYTAAGMAQRNRWVVEFPRDIRAPLSDGGWRLTRYGVAIDCKLLPIRPSAEPESTETLEELTA